MQTKTIHISQRKMEHEFHKHENDIFIAMVTGLFLSVVAFGLFNYFGAWAIVFAQLRSGVKNPMELNEAMILAVFIFFILMFASKFYKAKEYKDINKETDYYHMILGFVIIIPGFVNYNIQCLKDFLLIKSGKYSLNLAMDILKIAKPGVEVKNIYEGIKNYSEEQIRLTLLLLEKSEYIFINKKKWQCFTTDKGDSILFDWIQR